MSELDFESRLGGKLRAYAQGGVRPVDRYAIAESTVAAGSAGRHAFRLGRTRWSTTRSSRRMALILVAAATVLALAGGALLLSGGHPPAPMPTPPPNKTTPSPGATDTSGYEAILVRPTSDPRAERGYTIAAEMDIVAVRSDGRERLIGHLSSSILPAGRSFRDGGPLSEDGWLAMPTFVGDPDKEFAWALIDLAHPAREPMLVPSVLGGAWGPRGLFATAISCCWRVMTVDAKTGITSTRIGAGSLPGGGPSIIWAADGSGLVVVGPEDASGQPGYGIAPIDGGPRTSGVPALAPGMGPRIFGADGAMICVSFFTSCRSSDRIVEVRAATGVTTTWYGEELAPARLVQSSFAADGRSIWLLFDRDDGPNHVAVIARADAPGKAHVVATVDLGPGVVAATFSMAPDDSIIEVATERLGGEPTAGPGLLITTADGAAYAHVAGMLGFVRGPVADALPSGSTFSPIPGATTPSASPSGR